MLTMRNVTVRYEREVLKSVTAECRRGEVTALMGRNGSGKSTLLKAILGDVGSEGTIEYDGQLLSALPAKQRARCVAVVEQTVPIVPITIRDYILMGRMPYRKFFSMNYSEEDNAVVERLMLAMSIEHLADRRMDMVSGGERQLAAVAQAMSQEPKVLLLDEPASNLDIVNRHELYTAVVDMTRRRDMVTIVVAHDIASVKRYADKVIMLREGSVVGSGEVGRMLDKTHLESTYGIEIDKIADI